MNSNSLFSNDDLNELEALMTRRLQIGWGKYKGKPPIICISCKTVSHITAICLDREEKDERRVNKYEGKRDGRDSRRNKEYKDKGKKSCYISKEETDNESDSNDEEVVYVPIKEDYDVFSYILFC